MSDEFTPYILNNPKVGQIERVTQNRIIELFKKHLKYDYLGNFQDRENNKNIEQEILKKWLIKQGNSKDIITKVFRKIDEDSSVGVGKNLYDANKSFYSLLRYGVKVKEGTGEQNQTVWLIDWENIEKNDFAIAEEVSIKGENKKRPDIVIYVNGIALAVIELKRSTVSVSEGIRQNLDNQKKDFIRNFFTTIQLVMAGNDTEGLKYGTTETPEKKFLSWKEENPNYKPDIDNQEKKYLPSDSSEVSNNRLDSDLFRFANKKRFLDIIHNFIVFDAGIKKTCRHNQFFGIQYAKKYIQNNENGIIWHSQGSGKSLTMVWLAKWIRENIKDSRILIITDRTELDDQIEKVFLGVNEKIYRTTSGKDLISNLNNTTPWLICSLVHKFGKNEETSTNDFIEELESTLTSNFSPKGQLFVFVDECHRTQSGKLNKAMKAILPNASFIGFTGTPLLKDDKQKSVEIFGSYIHTYKFNEAVADGVVLDLRYEARDIDQNLTSIKKVDQWFEVKTKGLSEIAKTQLKQKWGTMQKVLSSQSRLEQIVNDILMDMETKPRLMDGRGNAMLVCSSIYQACKVYELFSQTDLAKKCAIITSYQPNPSNIKGEETGEGLTEKIRQYDIYRKMLASYFEENEETAMKKTERFEEEVKTKFINEPGQMKLLIVVDKLLTGFDAPSATYLYIDKQMRDHGLFQAICRVNRLDGDDKDYGYIIDYKDLFASGKIKEAIHDYTKGALDGYDENDIKELLTNRLEKAREKLDQARESVKALCEAVMEPKETTNYLHYFCAKDTSDKEELKNNESKRLTLYKLVSSLIRAYANIANEMEEAGYEQWEINKIIAEVTHYEKVKTEIKLASGDYIDMKLYEPAMRHLLDTYIRAEESEVVSDFEEFSLINLIVESGIGALDKLPNGIKSNKEAMSETIENNMRKIIIDENPINPKYYEKMSELLDALIQERKEKALEYQQYLEKIKDLADKIIKPTGVGVVSYPKNINTKAKKNLYDNLNQNEELTILVNKTILETKKEGWKGSKIKERELEHSIREVLHDYEYSLEQIMDIIKNQKDYE